MPTTNEIVNAVVAGLGKLTISKEVTEFSHTSVPSLREDSGSLKAESKVAYDEGELKAQTILDLEAKLVEAPTIAHEWYVKAKELETLLQQAKANEDWARSMVSQSVRSAPRPQGSGIEGSGSHGSHSASPARGPPPKP